ncbi:hypothetical protein CR513_18095, partial [Mucuna pruriens]
MVNEVGVIDNLRLENQFTELTSLVRQLVVGQHQLSATARVCGICTSVEHPIDMCPTLQETESDHPESVGSIAISAKSEVRAISSSKIWIRLDCASESKWLSVDSEIPSTTIPIVATTKSAIKGQFTIFGGPDEAVGNKQPEVSA